MFGLSITSHNEILITHLSKYDIIDRLLEMSLNSDDGLKTAYYSTVTMLHFTFQKEIIPILI